MVRDFFKNYKWDGRPWLIVGMGPSFSELKHHDISKYNVMGINRVVREIPVDICHIIDYYIVDKVYKSIETQATWLVCPYYPHFACRPNPMMSLEYVSGSLRFKDKLLGYNLATFPLPYAKGPLIHARYFTAEASLNLVANLGCKEVYACGIDGGRTRAIEYADHGPTDPRGFDLQWWNIARTIKHYGIKYSNFTGEPLNPKLVEQLELRS